MAGGSTLCSAICRKIVNEKGEEDVEIIVANLGDSRASLLVRHEDLTYRSYLLSEDHSLECDRIKNFIIKSGGSIFYDGCCFRVTGETPLNMGASFGDGKIPFLKREADIWCFRLSTFLQKGENLSNISANLIVSCDGLFEQLDEEGRYFSIGMNEEARAIVDDGGNVVKALFYETNKIIPEHDGIVFHMSWLKERFDLEQSMDEGFVLGEKFYNFAEFLMHVAFFGGSGDNISLINVPLVANNEIAVREGSPIMATICDGHGRGETYGPMSLWDGSLVSAAIAAKLFYAAKIAEIPGLEIDPEGLFSGFIFKEKERMASKPKVATSGRGGGGGCGGGGGGGSGGDGEEAVVAADLSAVSPNVETRIIDADQVSALQERRERET